MSLDEQIENKQRSVFPKQSPVLDSYFRRAAQGQNFSSWVFSEKLAEEQLAKEQLAYGKRRFLRKTFGMNLFNRTEVYFDHDNMTGILRKLNMAEHLVDANTVLAELLATKDVNYAPLEYFSVEKVPNQKNKNADPTKNFIYRVQYWHIPLPCDG